MHRLQISLPEWQSQFLSEQARRHGVSVAEVVRRLVRRAAESTRPPVEAKASLWEIAGIAEDPGELIEGTPVSESPELYLTGGRARRERSEPTT